MSKFAKLFDLDNGHQVLAISQFNPENDETVIEIRTKIDGVLLSAEIGRNDGPASESKVWTQEVLSSYTKESATKFFNTMFNLIDPNNNDE